MFLPILLSLGLTLGTSADNSCEAARAAAMNAVVECVATGDPYSTSCKLVREKLAASKDACNL